MTSTRSASRSTSSRMWLEKRIVRPSAAMRRRSVIMWSRWRGSMPLNGSSRTSAGGSWTSAAATLIRCRMPLL